MSNYVHADSSPNLITKDLGRDPLANVNSSLLDSKILNAVGPSHVPFPRRIRFFVQVLHGSDEGPDGDEACELQAPRIPADERRVGHSELEREFTARDHRLNRC